MLRCVYTMKLKPGTVAEYKRRHEAIWPELARALREAGILDYSIYLDEQNLTLVAVQTRSEHHTVADLPHQPIVKKWWAYMAPLMEVHPDNSPVETALEAVFHLD